MTRARSPQHVAPARIEPMATLPLFHKLAGRKVVVAGDTDGAVWKAELLAAAGAQVHVFAGGETERFEAVKDGLQSGHMIIAARAWSPPDLDGAAIAIAEAHTEEEAQAFVACAHAAGAVVNIIDRPDFCDAQFGAIVNRSPLLVAISTDGAAPVFGQAIRTRIETLLPRGMKAWAGAARDWRPFVQARALGFAARRAFWETFTARAILAGNTLPDETDLNAMLAALGEIAAAPQAGRVTLVGAGPGDPDLLTLKAVRALQSADIILYDDLVSADVLELARREARRMLVGKRGHGPSCSQSDINALMVKLALQGKHVVRLKSGDPLVYGRASEEIAACRAAGIAVAIVPGITAAQGAGASLGISLTERHTAQRLQFVTGHGCEGALPEDMDWQALADPSATTIIYMPRRTLAQFRDKATARGLDPAIPAVAIVNISRPEETRLLSTLGELPQRLAELPEGPMIVMIGHVLNKVGIGGGITHQDMPQSDTVGIEDHSSQREAHVAA